MAAIAAERINICRRETSAGKPCSDTVVLLIDEVRTPGDPAVRDALVRCAQVIRVFAPRRVARCSTVLCCEVVGDRAL